MIPYQTHIQSPRCLGTSQHRNFFDFHCNFSSNPRFSHLSISTSRGSQRELRWLVSLGTSLKLPKPFGSRSLPRYGEKNVGKMKKIDFFAFSRENCHLFLNCYE